MFVAHARAAEPQTQSRSELVLFASGEAYTLQDSEIEDDSLDGLLTADILGSWTAGRFRVLAELLLATDEQELERLQVGWEAVPETMLWIGRFHQPGSFWSSRQHHGVYLQTSITRPAIEDWEDDSGVLPHHVEGLLAESRLELSGSHGLMIMASAGIAPVLEDGALEPFDILDPRGDDRGVSFGLQAAFLPDYSSGDGFGLVASHSEIMLGENDGLDRHGHVDLDVAGLFVDVGHGPWQVTSTVYWIWSSFSASGYGAGDSFVSGYFQLQRQIGAHVTALARIEASSDADESEYIALFDDFVDERSVIDLRWDFAPHHALTFEWADTGTLHDSYQEYRLQWSAAFR
jgi:hypothetical protein